jgi:hypothetical protein
MHAMEERQLCIHKRLNSIRANRSPSISSPCPRKPRIILGGSIKYSRNSVSINSNMRGRAPHKGIQGRYVFCKPR